MIDCLQNIVGLAIANSNCLENSKPNDFGLLNDSKSGFYLTDRQFGAPLLDAVLEANDLQDGDNVWTTLIDIRNNAITSFQTDLQSTLKTHYNKRDLWADEIGSRNANRTRKVGNFAGIQIHPRWLKDYAYNITSLYAGFDTTGSVDVTVSSNNPDFEEQTFTLVTEAGKFVKTTLETPLVLPFQSRAKIYDTNVSDRFIYNLSYQTEYLALDNQLRCTTCGRRRIERYDKFFNVGGFSSNSIPSGCATNGAAMGLVLDGFLGCDNLNWICELDKIGRFDTLQTVAECVLNKCVMLMCQHILDSSNTSFFTTLRREAIYGKRSHAKKEYEGLLNFITLNLPKGATDCYECKQTMHLASL